MGTSCTTARRRGAPPAMAISWRTAFLAIIIILLAGTARGASFGWSGIAQDISGNTFLADAQTIYKLSPTGDVTILAGSTTTTGYIDGFNETARLNFPTAMVFDKGGLDKSLYVCDSSNNRIRKISASGWVWTMAGNGVEDDVGGSGTAASLSRPNGIVIDSGGSFYVTTLKGFVSISPAGVVTSRIGWYNPTAWPTVAASIAFSTFGATDAIAIDSQDNMYILNTRHWLIYKVTPAGSFSILAGSAIQGYKDGPGNVAQFRDLHGIAADSNGNIYVSDDVYIRKVTPAGYVTTLAGSVRGYLDAFGTGAQFTSPRGVDVDTGGNVYVTEPETQRVRKITAQGLVSTYLQPDSGAPPGAASPPPPPTPSIAEVLITIAADYNGLATNPTRLNAFIADLKRALATAANIPLEDVTYKGITPGSVIAAATLRFPSSSAAVAFVSKAANDPTNVFGASFKSNYGDVTRVQGTVDGGLIEPKMDSMSAIVDFFKTSGGGAAIFAIVVACLFFIVAMYYVGRSAKARYLDWKERRDAAKGSGSKADISKGNVRPGRGRTDRGAAGFKSDGAQGVGEAREAHVEIHLVDPDGEPTLGPLSAALRGKTPQRAQRSPWSPGVRR